MIYSNIFLIGPLFLLGVWLEKNKRDGIMSSIFAVNSEQN